MSTSALSRLVVRPGWTRLQVGLLAAVVLLASGTAGAGDLHPEVEAHLAALPAGGMLAVIVEMTDQADPRAAALAAPSQDRVTRTRAVLNALQDTALQQGPVRALLAREQSAGNVQRVVPFWIFNGFAVTATEPVIRALATRPDIREVRPDRLIPRPTPIPAADIPALAAVEWNIAKVRAPEVWALNPAYNGGGQVVGSFDSGVDLSHPDLASRYRGNHAISWFDPYEQHATPFDFDGHGTHTTGTAVGGNAGGTDIGVAPGAQWIAAKAWNDAGLSTTSAFHQVFQWFLAPGGDPANAPGVVNNSWSFTNSGCSTEFQADVQAWRAAGIFPAFASGNNGPAVGSARAPGAYAQSYAVGATNSADNVASFSGRGPSPCDGAIKPDVSAPGVSVKSSLPGGGYTAFDGTSMATPHVTGAVAVLRSIDPTLTVDALEAAITQSAVDRGLVGPDNRYGAGRLDLFQAAQIVLGEPTTLDASPTSVPAGGTLTVTWSGLVSPSGTDWIGLYAVGTDDGAYLAWRYVSCTQTPGAPQAAGSCPFPVPGTLAQGAYELRLFSNDGTLRLATSNTVTVTVPSGPTLSASPTSVPAGGTLTVTWSGLVSPSGTDWIGLYAVGTDDGAYLAWRYVSCTQTPGAPQAAGSCPFPVPGTLAQGAYELRLFSNNSFTWRATSNIFTVPAP